MHLIALAVAGCVSPASGDERIPVLLQRRGDDGLTLRLMEALLVEAGKEQSFRVVSESSVGVKIIRLAGPLSWKATPDGNRVEYLVEVEAVGGSVKRSISGTCLDSDFVQCSHEILAKARATLLDEPEIRF